MAITNITGQKPEPIVESNTLDVALSKKIASANILRKALVEAIKDILLQYKSNFNLESDERNVKIVDCIMKRHKALLDNMLSKDINVENIMSALDLHIEDWLSRFYLLSKPRSGPDDVRTIKEDVIKCILDALKQYSGKEIETLSSIIETTIVDKNENIDNFDALNNYFMNILTFMKDQYKSKLTVVKTIDKVEKVEQKNLIKKLSVVTKTSKAGIMFNSIKSKLNIFKTNLSAKFNKPITFNDRQPKKSLNPFRSFDFNKRIGLNKSLNIGLKKFLDISRLAVIKDVIGKIATTLLNKMKPLINKVKKVINKIKSVIVNFMLSLIPFVGPIIKVVKFVLKPILFTLKIAFKILSFAVKFIGKTIGLIFTGVFKLMKFTITSMTKTIGFLTKGIYKILKSNIVKKIIAFMLTPTGAFITGFIVGMFYVKIWKPLKEKIDLAGGFIATVKNIYKTVKDKIISWKNTLSENYALLKKKLLKPGGKMQKAMDFIKNLNSNTLLAAWETFKIKINLKIIRPIMNIFNGIVEMFVDGGIHAASNALAKLIVKGLNLIPPPWGMILSGLVGIGAGLWDLFFAKSDKKRNEKDEVTQRKQEYLKLYGVNSLDSQANHATLIDLQTQANAEKSLIDSETKKKINDKIRAEKMTGVITVKLQRFLDNISDAIKKELEVCKQYSDLTKQEIDSAQGETLDAVGSTKIPIPTKFDANGNMIESSTILDLPNSIHPIMFKMIRANMLYSMLLKYYNGLITYDDFIEYYQNMTKFDANGKLLIDSNVLNEAKKLSNVDVDSMLKFNNNGKVNKSAKNAFEEFTWSDQFLDSAANEAQQKKNIIDKIFQKFLNAHLFDFIPFEKRAIVLSKFNAALMKIDLKEFSSKSQDEQVKWLMDLYNGLNIDIDKLLREKEEKELEYKDSDDTDVDVDVDDELDDSIPNELTVLQIQELKTAAEKINLNDAKTNIEMNNLMSSTNDEINHNIEKEALQSKNDTSEVKSSISLTLDNIIDKANTLLTPNKAVAVIGNETHINPAAEEAQRIMNEQIT